MKKTLILATLGFAASVATSFGQGSIAFSSYYGNGGAGINTYLFGSSTAVPDGFHADLYYFLGNNAGLDSVNVGSVDSVTSLPTGLTDLGLSGAIFTTSGGFWGNPLASSVVTVPGYASGAVTYEIVVYNGSDYATSTIRGRSGTFVVNPGAATGSNPVPTIGGAPDIFVGNVTVVPEPSTLALAGLGGFGMLMALRRKKA